jgi:hypothetical protein
MGHCDKPGTGGERINKVDRLTWPGQRYFPYEILIFLCPEPIGFEPAQRTGRNAVHQLAALTIGARLAVADAYGSSVLYRSDAHGRCGYFQ